MMLKHEYGTLLSHHTSLKIGGPVSSWLEPENFDDILETVSFAETNNKVLAVIGKGSNILAHDKGFDGVLINLGRGFDYIENQEEGILSVGASVSISQLVKQCAGWGLGGCEFLAGIPGSFGGAVFMNAGVRDINDAEKLREIKDIILNVDVFDLKDKKRKNIAGSNIDFSYRSSGLDGQCILGARIKLEKDKKGAIISRIDSYMKKREWIQKMRYPSAGSIFKNPDRGDPAARLIERSGLKGTRIGGAEISKIHANFIVNIDGATSKDVLDLIELTRKSVKEKFGVELELELKII